MMNDLSPDEFDAVVDNDVDFFLEQEFTDKKKLDFLHTACSKGKLDIIKHFMEQGIKIINSSCLIELVEKKKKTGVLEYLDTQGYDLTKKGHVLLWKAALANNPNMVKYLADKITETDHSIVIRSINNIISDYETNIETVKKSLEYLLPKVSSEKLYQLLLPVSPDNQKFIMNLYLSLTIDDIKDVKLKVKL